MNHRFQNRLIQESSPYLLQHAHNPVDWYPWGEEAFAKAREKDLPMLVSIGYSTCHWCHVMERESFENEQIADLMNKHFVCIKLDREERPDVDQVYMDAVQAMGVRGGWPLNVFLTPEAKPFYGGTYFPPQHWAQLLQNVAEAYSGQREKLAESAEEFANALRQNSLPFKSGEGQDFEISLREINDMVQTLGPKLDKQLGGTVGAPKFPMPSIWRMLLHIGEKNALPAAQFTIVSMLHGGIYDHVGGGFARYSTDAQWLVPHFEKMLYDNGQLLSLMAEGYLMGGDRILPHYIDQTISYLEREMSSPEDAYYAALDADSEGVEGKFYVWKLNEVSEILGENAPEYISLYNITEEGNWEEGINIPHLKGGQPSLQALPPGIKALNLKMLNARTKRIRPSTDTKVLASWNALALSGLCHCSRFVDGKYLPLAERVGTFLRDGMWTGSHILRSHGKDIIGFLDDHTLAAQAFIDLYYATFEEEWMHLAKDIAEATIANFLDREDGFFFYSSKNSEKLIAAKKEVFDNVIPSGNAVMANVLTELGLINDRPDLLKIATEMLAKVKPLMLKEPQHLSHWGMVAARHAKDLPQLVVTGKDAGKKLREITLGRQLKPLGMSVFAIAGKSSLPILQEKSTEDGREFSFHVCFGNTCLLPTASLKEALKSLEGKSI